MPNQVIGTMEIRPIFYFYMNAPEIQLSSNLRIRAITKTEKFPRNDLSGTGLGWGMEYGYDSLFFVVDCFDTTREKASDEIERLGTCLLLYKPNSLGNPLPWFILANLAGHNSGINQLTTLDQFDLENIPYKRTDP